VIRSVLTLGGPPGSGKSTAARAVAAALGLEYRSAGELFRAEAARRGMDLEAFGHFAETHPEVDRALDREMRTLAVPGRLVEGRVQGALCRRAGIPVIAIVVTATEDVRVARVSGRDGHSLEETRRRLREREASEKARYLRYYGIDLDREPADLTVDSTSLAPDGVAEAIVAFVRSREAAP
jgi:cytidylate kinase